MFIDYVGYFHNNGKYEYTITDTDFTETVYTSQPTVILAVIEVYSKRNLNVAYNLFLCLKCIQSILNTQNLLWFIDYHNENTPGFSKYKKDIEKYLLLL